MRMSLSLENRNVRSYKCQNTEEHMEDHAVSQCNGGLLFACVFVLALLRRG